MTSVKDLFQKSGRIIEQLANYSSVEITCSARVDLHRSFSFSPSGGITNTIAVFLSVSPCSPSLAAGRKPTVKAEMWPACSTALAASPSCSIWCAAAWPEVPTIIGAAEAFGADLPSQCLLKRLHLNKSNFFCMFFFFPTCLNIQHLAQCRTSVTWHTFSFIEACCWIIFKVFECDTPCPGCLRDPGRGFFFWARCMLYVHCYDSVCSLSILMHFLILCFFRGAFK